MKAKEFWEKRWLKNQIGWDLGQVSPPIKAYIDQLENKAFKILIPGCGNAHEAEYLNEKGFKNVYIVDVALEAINSFKKRYPSFPDSQIIHGDFFELNESFDLIIEQTFFCAINPKLRNTYAKKVYDLLNSKGKLVGVLFNRTFKDGPPYGGSAKEYGVIFEKKMEILSMANCHNSVIPRQGSEVFIILQRK